MAEQPSTFQQVYTPGSDIGVGYETAQLNWGRTGNDFMLGYQKVNPGPLPTQIDFLLGDVAIDDPQGRQWRDTFALGDWQKSYYANPGFSLYGLNEYAVITDFNPQLDRVQLFGNANNYRTLSLATGTLLLLQKPTQLDVVAFFLGTPSLNLNASYMEYKGNTAAARANPRIQQQAFGTAGFDIAFATTTDVSGNVYQAGGTHGAIAGGRNNNESRDNAIVKYSPQGNVLWSKQFGSNRFDSIWAIRTDAQGNVYVAGATFGNLYATKAGEVSDVFLVKLDPNGQEIWTRQFGYPLGASFINTAFSMDLDAAGNVYLSGLSARTVGLDPLPRDDFWVTRYDPNGNRQWFTEFGTSDYDEPYATAVSNDGSIYAAGWTFANFAGPNQGTYDGAIAKLTPTGEVVWRRQLGSTDYDWIWGADTDSQGNLYVSGYTLGSLPGNTSAGSSDAFLAKYDKDGNRLWVQQFGTPGDDQGWKLVIDSSDRIFLTGFTNGTFPGNRNAGNYDAWLASFNTDGTRRWIRQFGSNEIDHGYDVTTDNRGNVYVTGLTQGSLGATNAGSFDGWIAKFNTAGTLRNFGPPAPATPTTSTFAVGNTLGNPNVTDPVATLVLRSIFETLPRQIGLPIGSGGAAGTNIDDLLRAPLPVPGIPTGILPPTTSPLRVNPRTGEFTSITPLSGIRRAGQSATESRSLTNDNNIFQGSESSESVSGRGGHDRLAGMGGTDIIRGGSGNDRLIGGQGDDRLVGGLGADTFVLSRRGGTDAIVDFSLEEGDRLALSGTLTLKEIQIVQGTGFNVNNTLIQNGENTLAILQGISANQITPSAFV
ncbi:MAG: SBBP repeat-containing protein [Oculatellaceae cyanobacterium Prado106]|nr:SBBP repeat-containing protein [Oculatellaceae cyanobacterium Prado106]